MECSIPPPFLKISESCCGDREHEPPNRTPPRDHSYQGSNRREFVPTKCCTSYHVILVIHFYIKGEKQAFRMLLPLARTRLWLESHILHLAPFFLNVVLYPLGHPTLPALGSQFIQHPPRIHHMTTFIGDGESGDFGISEHKRRG